LRWVLKNAIVGYMENEVIAPTETLMFFAYGTLRKGEPLHEQWLKNIIVNEVGEAKLRYARLFYGVNHKSYPYCVWTKKFDDEAVGELYEVRVCSEFVDLLRMETNSGYRMSEGEVELADGRREMALICTWEETHGGAVPDNNWLSAERSVWW